MTARRIRHKRAKRAEVARWVRVAEHDVPRRLDRLLQRARRHREGVVIVGADGQARAALIPAATWNALHQPLPTLKAFPDPPTEHADGSWIGTPLED